MRSHSFASSNESNFDKWLPAETKELRLLDRIDKKDRMLFRELRRAD